MRLAAGDSRLPHPLPKFRFGSIIASNKQVTTARHQNRSRGVEPRSQPIFHAAPVALHSEGWQFGPLVFHRATFSVSESYIGRTKPRCVRDLSLTPDFSHLILGTRPGRGRHTQVVYFVPIRQCSLTSHAAASRFRLLAERGGVYASRSKLAVIAGPRLWRTYP